MPSRPVEIKRTEVNARSLNAVRIFTESRSFANLCGEVFFDEAHRGALVETLPGSEIMKSADLDYFIQKFSGTKVLSTEKPMIKLNVSLKDL